MFVAEPAAKLNIAENWSSHTFVFRFNCPSFFGVVGKNDGWIVADSTFEGTRMTIAGPWEDSLCRICNLPGKTVRCAVADEQRRLYLFGADDGLYGITKEIRKTSNSRGIPSR